MCTKTIRSLHVLLIKQIVVLESREKEGDRQKEEKKRESKRERGGGSEREREQSNLYGHKTRKNIRII